MVNEEDKQSHKLNKKSIEDELKKSQYVERFAFFKTHLEQGECRWRKGKHVHFEDDLEVANLRYFAYIKFYLEDNNMYALVAGKTGSRIVNAYGSDVRFQVYPKKGKAKKWLYDNDKDWCQTEILVVATISEDKEESNREALAIEKN